MEGTYNMSQKVCPIPVLHVCNTMEQEILLSLVKVMQSLLLIIQFQVKQSQFHCSVGHQVRVMFNQLLPVMKTCTLCIRHRESRSHYSLNVCLLSFLRGFQNPYFMICCKPTSISRFISDKLVCDN